MKILSIFFFCCSFFSLSVSAQSQDKFLPTDTLLEVVVTSFLRSANISSTPAPIQVLTKKELDQFAGSNVGELYSKLQGVEFTRYGVDGTTFNARGLNSAFNNKILQIVDGRISTSALSGGLPVFNNGSTIVDDIKQVEILLGPQTALYGPNAHNGVFNIVTQDPRLYPGTSVSLSIGNQHQFSGRFRHAQKIDDRWAYKVTGEDVRGREFQFIDSVYFDKFSPKGIPEQNVNFEFRHLRGEAHLYYSINPQAEIILSSGASSNDFLQVTTGGRNQMRGLSYSFLQARYKSPHISANIYNTWGTLGSSYVISGYTRVFWLRTQPGPSYLPPDEAEKIALVASQINENSRRFNADFQYRKNFTKLGLLLIGGIDFENVSPNTLGGNSVVGEANDISVSQLGAVMQLEKKLMNEMRLIGAIRFDNNENFENLIAPKFTFVKDFDQGNIRFGWAKAYALPSIQNQYASINGFLFGNGVRGISYIPNNAKVDDPASILTTTPLKPEEVQTWEIGIRGQAIKRIWIDANAYYGQSKNFITPAMFVGGRALSVNGFSVNPLLAGTVNNNILQDAEFFTFFNYGKATIYGLDLEANYTIIPAFHLTFKYSWFNTEFKENDANKDGEISNFEESINAPNHRGLVSLTLEDLFKDRLTLSFWTRLMEKYDFYSGDQVGSSEGAGTRTAPYNFNYGPLGGFITFNLSAEYALRQNVAIKVNMTNIFNTRQIEFVGSPSIGRLAMASIKLKT